MIVGGGLLGDLQGELRRFVADLGGRVSEDSAAAEGLRGEWSEALAANRTGRTFESWLEDRLIQVAVAWLLAGVFVRFGEDNGLIAEPMIAGPGDRGGAARAAQQRYFAEHPHDSDRQYLQHVFRTAATLPGLHGLLADGESPLWLLDPPADACTRLIELFRATDGGSGALRHDFTDPALDTRFLGDLYQDLSEQARSDYALLQTPEFVEEFILDRTLNPAIETFGLARTTLIDPTCGSGHFLLGAFDRLWSAWRTAEPATPERVRAERALAAVTGVDLNPFAAAIARFRLLVAALQVCQITDLRDAPDFTVDVAVGDSLLWGARPGQLAGMEAAATADARKFLYQTEHAAHLQRVFAKKYTAVVGNPPYIIARDSALNQQYRDRYESCHRQYSLAVPFMECLFDLALQPDGMGRPAGHVGMITANSFMKREFGKKLVEDFIPRWDLTHVIDTGSLRPEGHTTPTVILFGRHQSPVRSSLVVVGGIKGEQPQPTDLGSGRVWRSIISMVDHGPTGNEYISVSLVDRRRLSKHPWSIGGGGAADLKDRLDIMANARLEDEVLELGFMAITGEDNVYVLGRCIDRSRHHLPPGPALVEGDLVRDWCSGRGYDVFWPYSKMELLPLDGATLSYAWPYRTNLETRKRFGIEMHRLGRPWHEWRELYPTKIETPLSIAVAAVATHNHFVLDRGGKLYKQSAPVIKLPAGSTVDSHLALIGLLNSSVACFWMNQVSNPKPNPGDTLWQTRFDYDASKLKQFPLPLGTWPVGLATQLDSLASVWSGLQPVAVCRSGVPSRGRLDAARVEAESVFAEMVAWQEELDWTCLHLYGLTDDPLTVPEGETPPPLQLGERAFEIILARKLAAGEVDTAWFTRHRSTPITEVPAHWPDWYRQLVKRRIDLIEADRDVALVERPEHKRRWARELWETLEKSALHDWLADRLEDRALWFEGSGPDERAVCRSVAQLADRLATDTDFTDVARLWTGRVEIDLVAVISDLVADEHVPAQAAARYKPSGLAKRAQWERTWELQRLEDRGEPLPDGLTRIPVPPKYAQGDFATTSYWRQRGKLDVPKERFTSIAAAARDTDPTPVLAWAGFDHAQLAQAIGTLLVERQQLDGWNPERTWPFVVALTELLPWLDQWHHTIDPRWGASPAQLYRNIAEQHALTAGHTLNDTTTWQPPPPTRKPRTTRARVVTA